jgi:hypothetical protein
MLFGGIMGAVVEFRVLEKDEPSYDEGLSAGRLAREQGLELSRYHEVGIDDYAKGFRAGYFSQLGLTGTWAG